jgi:hypothetical protein
MLGTLKSTHIGNPQGDPKHRALRSQIAPKKTDYILYCIKIMTNVEIQVY